MFFIAFLAVLPDPRNLEPHAPGSSVRLFVPSPSTSGAALRRKIPRCDGAVHWHRRTRGGRAAGLGPDLDRRRRVMLPLVATEPAGELFRELSG
jgi:hypothetical protein